MCSVKAHSHKDSEEHEAIYQKNWILQKIDRITRSDFFYLKICQLLGVVYIAIFSFSTPPVGVRDAGTGFIIDPNSEENTENGVIYMNGAYRPVVAEDSGQLFCLAISRVMAFLCIHV